MRSLLHCAKTYMMNKQAIMKLPKSYRSLSTEKEKHKAHPLFSFFKGDGRDLLCWSLRASTFSSSLFSFFNLFFSFLLSTSRNFLNRANHLHPKPPIIPPSVQQPLCRDPNLSKNKSSTVSVRFKVNSRFPVPPNWSYGWRKQTIMFCPNIW